MFSPDNKVLRDIQRFNLLVDLVDEAGNFKKISIYNSSLIFYISL